MKKFFIIASIIVSGLFMFSCEEEISPVGISEEPSLEVPIDELSTDGEEQEDDGLTVVR